MPARRLCSFPGCRRIGYGHPLLCDDHAEEVESESVYEEVIDEVLEHPQMRRVLDRAVGLLDKVSDVIDQAKRGEFPRVHRPVGETPPPRPRTPDLVAQARELFHFGPLEVLTVDAIRKRKHDLAQMVHPDHGGSTDAMARINRAAEILLRSVTP